jgi:hypothetical protein
LTPALKTILDALLPHRAEKEARVEEKQEFEVSIDYENEEQRNTLPEILDQLCWCVDPLGEALRNGLQAIGSILPDGWASMRCTRLCGASQGRRL